MFALNGYTRRSPRENHRSPNHRRTQFDFWTVPDRFTDPSAVPPFRIEKMIRTTHTLEEFDELSMYFQAKEEEFRKKAEDQKEVLNRRLAIPWGSSKYPTAADSRARGLLQYYQGKADEFAQRAKTYHYGQQMLTRSRLHP